ncbi:MAG: efflux RND transporter periplasmic adaptor subunit [Steroidobacteraceae bacterium]
MKRAHTFLVAATAIAAVAGLLIWGFIAGRSEAAADAESEQPVTPAVQVSQKPLGPPTLTVSPQLQKQAGIEVHPARPAPYQGHIDAYGSVLGLQALTGVANTLATANAQRAIAQAKVTASRAALQRAQLLFKDDRNFSRAQLQAASAAFRTDEAGLRAAQVQAEGAAAEAGQAWGPVLERSLASNGPLAQSLLQHRQVLIQITLPLGTILQGPPQTASIEAAGGKPVPAQLVSAAVSTDPRIQGASYFFTAAAANGLLPGMNVIARLPAGKPAPGIAIPASAVVWLQGRAWIYLRVGPDSFTRRPISTAQPQPDGGYVLAAHSLPAGSSLVVTGAQMLLSQEFSAEIDVSD